MDAAALRAQIETVLDPAYGPAFVFPERRSPAGQDRQPTGIPQVDALTGGLPRGALTEIIGPVSSGRTSVLMSLLATMTANDEVCALVDAQDAFDPRSAREAGVDLKRLLWVRCHNHSGKWPVVSGETRDGVRGLGFGVREEKQYGQALFEPRTPNSEPRFNAGSMARALKVTDLLLHSGGFGLVALDAGDVPRKMLRHVPLAYWFRFLRAIEHTPTILLLLEPESTAQSAASLVLRLNRRATRWSRALGAATGNRAPQACLLQGREMEAEVVRTRDFRCVRCAQHMFSVDDCRLVGRQLSAISSQQSAACHSGPVRLSSRYFAQGKLCEESRSEILGPRNAILR